MNDTFSREFDSLVRGKQFGDDHPLVPANAAATAAFTALGNSINQVETIESGRLNGTNTFRGATAERRFLRDQLRSAVSDLSRVSKGLDKTVYPDVAAQLKMGRLNSYASLIMHATNTITVVTPIKQVFIDRGAAATVIEDLQSSIDALVAATGRGFSGRGTQIGKNVDLYFAIRAGREQIGILDGILSILLKPTPGLLAEWRAAKRVQRAPEATPAQGGSGPGSGSGTQPVVS